MRKFDQTVCEMLKKRNKLQHSRRSREKMLAQLSAQVETMRGEAKDIETAPAGDSEAASQLRQLENRLDKMVVKCSEASHIRKTYEMILQKLEEVSGFSHHQPGCKMCVCVCFRSVLGLIMPLLLWRKVYLAGKPSLETWRACAMMPSWLETWRR